MLFLIGVQGTFYFTAPSLSANGKSGVDQHFLRPVQLRGRFVVHGPNHDQMDRQPLQQRAGCQHLHTLAGCSAAIECQHRALGLLEVGRGDQDWPVHDTNNAFQLASDMLTQTATRLALATDNQQARFTLQLLQALQ
jgi:hypothetical protein|uniref:Uncharacterized protein n=1 Tax=Pseudomonas sp. R9 TaxID=101164 RepID=Q9RBV7_9PSED|nr:hypothetical protein E [Pseudomonas sp. R9]